MPAPAVAMDRFLVARASGPAQKKELHTKPVTQIQHQKSRSLLKNQRGPLREAHVMYLKDTRHP